MKKRYRMTRDKRFVVMDGQMYRIKYNETSAIIKKREVREGNIGVTMRDSFCGHPDKLRALIREGWKIVGGEKNADNWKHLVREKHNSSDCSNKKREEFELQAKGIDGEGKIYTDEYEVPDAETNGTDAKPNLIASFGELVRKCVLGSKVVLYAAIATAAVILIWLISLVVR